MIVVEDVVYEYPSKRALDGVSFTIPAGTITAMVGPNGAGKTTLLRCLAALEPPYSGRITIDGVDTREDPRRIHELLGYLPDFFGLYEELPVWRALYFAARSHRLNAADAEKAVAETAAAVGLADRLNQRAQELSRGLRQRLAIGQAIVHKPKVILLDEPAAGLDPESRRSLSQLLISLRDRGMTLIVSSHILAELDDYATEMLIIKDGKIAGGSAVTTRAGDQVKVRVETASNDPRLLQLVSGRSDVTVSTSGADHVEVILSNDRAAHAALLRSLIEAGLSVCVFAPQKITLEDTYFNETRKG
ncbi:MAG TPA: ABC transporter ATP-binding protein [Alphaproteobacteria bacterium]|nr:ABC transporter ATP-binding protein [Alphaproteobacteria bacterium]HAJ47789.1 ABC transporter ATP-binding protein [Alphaproteobacteria bacterium]